jgi:hypothetical protein
MGYQGKLAERRQARRFFEVDEARLRVRLYLHEGLDLAASVGFWSELTGIPPAQFLKPDRAVPDPACGTPSMCMAA